MPRKFVFPPPIRLHKATNSARVWAEGKWHYLGAYGSTEAQQAYARLLGRLSAHNSEVRAHEPPSERATVFTVADACAAWLAAELPKKGPADRRKYPRSLLPVLRLFGTLPAAKFTRARLEDVQAAMLSGTWQNAADREQAKKRGQPLRWGAVTINRHVARIGCVWRWLEGRELVPEGRWASLLTLPGLKVPRKERPHWREVWDRVRAVCRHVSPVVRAMLLTQWWTGARTGEIQSMRAGDVREGCYYPRQHKLSHLGITRVVPLGPRALAVLSPWLTAALAVGPDAFVFVPERGVRVGGRARKPKDHTRGYTESKYAQAVARGARAAGVELSPYCCRHASRNRIEEAAGAHAARCVLGHLHLSTTQKYGRSIDNDYAAEIQRKIG